MNMQSSCEKANGEMFMRAANAVIVSPTGRLLMLVSSPWEGRPERSQKPDLPGGSVEVDETVEEGLIREIQEEAGLEVDKDSMQLVYQRTKPARYQPGHFWHDHYFLAACSSEEVTLSFEHERYEWLDVDAFYTQQWRASQREVIDFLYQHDMLRQYIKESIKLS